MLDGGPPVRKGAHTKNPSFRDFSFFLPVALAALRPAATFWACVRLLGF